MRFSFELSWGEPEYEYVDLPLVLAELDLEPEFKPVIAGSKPTFFARGPQYATDSHYIVK